MDSNRATHIVLGVSLAVITISLVLLILENRKSISALEKSINTTL